MSISITVTEGDIEKRRRAEQHLFDLIRQINETEPPHLLRGRFRFGSDVETLLAELTKTEAEVSDAARRLIRIKAAIRAVLTSR